MPILYTKAPAYGGRLPPSWWASGSNGTFAGKDNLGDELTPNTAEINVVNDFPWTLTPTRSEARKEAPYIYLREFLQLETYLNQSLLPYAKSSAGGFIPTGRSLPNPSAGSGANQGIPAEDQEQGFLESVTGFAESVSNLLDQTIFGGLTPDANILYGGLFDHLTPTNFQYKLPFFTTEFFNVRNNWERTDVLDTLINFQTTVGGAIRTMIEAKFENSKFGKFMQNLPRNLKKLERFNIEAGNPAVGLMDPPHVWKGANNRTYTFQFPLYNINSTGTGSTNPINTIVKNWELCYLLTYQNLVNKRNYYTGIPPVFYEVHIPGVHYCKASYISDLSIKNIGNIRLMQLPLNGNSSCDVNVPDAYLVEITLTDLLQPSKNLLQGVTNTTTRESIRGGS